GVRGGGHWARGGQGGVGTTCPRGAGARLGSPGLRRCPGSALRGVAPRIPQWGGNLAGVPGRDVSREEYRLRLQPVGARLAVPAICLPVWRRVPVQLWRSPLRG